jgi:hypothetical protein
VKKDTYLKSLTVLATMVVYFTIAIGHIFFLPSGISSLPTHTTSKNSIFKRKGESLSVNDVQSNIVQRTDKSVLIDKRSVIDLLNAAVLSFIVLLFTLALWKVDLKRYRRFLSLPVHTPHSYLSLCTFRI